MTFHTGGFLEDIDSAGAFTPITALSDNRLFTQGDDLRVPSLNSVVAISGGLDNAVAARMRLTSPTLVQRARYDVVPTNQATGDVEPNDPQRVMDLRDAPLVLGVDELLRCEINSNPGAVADQWCLLWFADGPSQRVAPAGSFAVRGTGATTVVARAWSEVSLTLDDNLLPGDYQVIGARFEGATCIAGRVIFRTGDQWRPGALGNDDEVSLDHPMFRHGGLGIWGNFPFTQLPAMEYLCDVADTAQITFLDLVKVG